MRATIKTTAQVLSLLMAGASLAGCAASSVDSVDGGQRVGGASSTATGGPGATGGAGASVQTSAVAATGATTTAAAKAVAGKPGRAQQGAKPGTVPVAAAPADAGQSYRIGVRDTVDITVFMVPDLARTVTVSEAGTINFPLIGETMASGKTAREVELVLTQKLGEKYLQNPQVSVTVKEFNSQNVTIEGSVKKPGVYALRNSMSLVQVIAVGGGVDELSDEQVTISREQGGKRVASQYDLTAIRSGSLADPEVKAGDVVFVGKSSFKEALNNLSKVTPIAGVLRPF